MRYLLTIVVAALLCSTTTATGAPSGAGVCVESKRAGAPFAILDEDFARNVPASPLGESVIARADLARIRPPGAVGQLHTEGTLPGKGIREASLVAKRDFPITIDLALAWRLTGGSAYRDAAANYLDAWSQVYRPSFNPIDETGFDDLILACDLVCGDMQPAEQRQMAMFWRRLAQGYLDAMDGDPPNAATNWQSHRVKLATLASFRTGDSALIARARVAFRRQIAANLRPDGTTLDFKERDALHYVTYDLDPLLMAALAAKLHCEDWYGWSAPNGASLRRSLTWLSSFADGTRTHIEFARSKVAFDRQRAEAGQAEYAPHQWISSSARQTFALAQLLDPAFSETSARLSAAGGRDAPWLAIMAK